MGLCVGASGGSLMYTDVYIVSFWNIDRLEKHSFCVLNIKYQLLSLFCYAETFLKIAFIRHPG